MAYEKQEFTNGQVLTAEQLNRMSEGILALQEDVKHIEGVVATGILAATVERGDEA
jgi:hypothetical protein